MSFSQFLIIKAPSIACWGFGIVFAYQASSNYLFAFIALVLLVLGIHEYNKEDKKREEREQKDREAQAKADSDKFSRDLASKVFSKGIDKVSKWLDG